MRERSEDNNHGNLMHAHRNLNRTTFSEGFEFLLSKQLHRGGKLNSRSGTRSGEPVRPTLRRHDGYFPSRLLTFFIHFFVTFPRFTRNGEVCNLRNWLKAQMHCLKTERTARQQQ